jgi:hypothetical protein
LFNSKRVTGNLLFGVRGWRFEAEKQNVQASNLYPQAFNLEQPGALGGQTYLTNQPFN